MRAERTRQFHERYQSDEFSISAIQLLSCLDVEDAGQCIDLIKAWSNRGNAREEALPQPKRKTKSSVYNVEKTILVPSIEQRCGEDWASQRAATQELANSLNRLATSEAFDAAIKHIEETVTPRSGALG